MDIFMEVLSTSVKWIVGISCGIFMVMSVYQLIKLEANCKNRMTIIDAIGRYQFKCIEDRNYNFEVDFWDMESPGETDCRIWDWGYTRILPPEKFEIIKPFIKKGK